MIENFWKKYLSTGIKRKISFWGIDLEMKKYFLYSFLPIKEIALKEGRHWENRRNYLYIVCPYGIGDILVGKMLANKIKKRKKKIIFLIRENYFGINIVLEDSGKCIMDTKLARKVETYLLYKQKFCGKNYIYGHFPKSKDSSICIGLNTNKYVWQDYCIYVYSVERDSLYHIVNTDSFGKNIVKENRILLCPYAYSTGMLSVEFWELLVKKLLKKKYVVYTNVSKTEKEIKGTKRLECALNEISDIANQSKAVIAVRSGICDLLAVESLVPLYIINESEELANYWNLEYLRDKGIYNFLTTDHLIENILRKLEEKERI